MHLDCKSGQFESGLKVAECWEKQSCLCNNVVYFSARDQSSFKSLHNWIFPVEDPSRAGVVLGVVLKGIRAIDPSQGGIVRYE